ncbi:MULTISPECIES: threonine--tRNA ligase [spotted fever group]|uniref:threonine--tRNA ligase n=2 Tax=cellular organisms TaxID=131567 RepID=B7P8A8_IXOSC|nr:MULTISPECIES: threonine--tRNA ligase [spotted fever group]EEC02830.1 threonyl-tRNA synthetase, putative [Ixodes scapularis]EER22155.1 threonyl-tRNA synthetase [Rickettsia endosymbiont of Ixodes scapularis]KDO03503.1 Threonine--tRNA ligase [Rickettsia tamurae subsp. buchneri]|eukprot:XP_002401645.1 threonyl-tRNA synthetase, putative [Ixodes scapularis]
MINISFPDGSIKQFEKNITAYEVANAISMSLAKRAMVAEINGELKDLSTVIENDCKLRILTVKDPECLEIIRHDAAHLTAEAVKELFPETQVTIGPAIENGYYYDFARDKPFTTDDLAVIEAKMQELSKKNEKVTRELWDRDKAVEFFKSIGEHYKAEIIASIPAGEPITLYRQGDFIDLCLGPHAPSTGFVKHFKLMKVAGAYWRGDSCNEMLQRIYGTAWATKEQLDNYLFMLEEAEKRDHRKLGRELDLFHFQEEAQGMVFWHDKGWSIYNIIEQYIRKKIRKNGYIEVKTPVLVDKSLWEASGHWKKFRDDMFALETDDKTLALKPMNCPCHVQIFKQGIKSYRDLPLRMSEFGLCHRNEASGALHGLMRVRSLVQDDAHIFCAEEQITDETVSFCKLLTEVYKDFGFNDIKVKFSDRPEIRAGSDEVWDKAENALKEAVEKAGFTYTLNPGEGAFYGPKLEFVLTDAIGRQWQCGTLQMDFVLPERLDASYIAASGEKKRPVMLHRAILGSLERFIGILIEEYAGRFPLWITPIQVAVATITSDLNDYALEVQKALIDNGVRTDINISPDKINYKIREFSNQKIPMIAVIGKQEKENKQVTIRRLGTTEQEVLSIEQLIALVKEENSRYL